MNVISSRLYPKSWHIIWTGRAVSKIYGGNSERVHIFIYVLTTRKIYLTFLQRQSDRFSDIDEALAESFDSRYVC